MGLVCLLRGHRPTETVVPVNRGPGLPVPAADVDGQGYGHAAYCGRCLTWLTIPPGAVIPLPSLGPKPLEPEALANPPAWLRERTAPPSPVGVAVSLACCLVVSVGVAYDIGPVAGGILAVAWGALLISHGRDHRRYQGACARAADS